MVVACTNVACVVCAAGHTSQEVYLFQETHIMHVFEEDFYGSELKVAMLGYIRGEKNFDSLGELLNPSWTAVVFREVWGRQYVWFTEV